MDTQTRLQPLSKPLAWSTGAASERYPAVPSTERVRTRARIGTLARCVVRQALPWLGLLSLSSTVAYALEGTGGLPPAIPTVAPVSASLTAPVRQAATFGRPGNVVVTITLRDSKFGLDMPMRCVTLDDRVAWPELLVDAEYVRDVEAALCVSG
jgi:hypothetical protein